METKVHKCQHGPCTCDPRGANVYCCVECGDAALMEDELAWCDCGHITCTAAHRLAAPAE